MNAKVETKLKSNTNSEVKKPKIDKQGRSYGTGRRKISVARVWVKPGKGNIIINDCDAEKYLKSKTRVMIINQPFIATDSFGKFDIICTVTRGGLSGQAGAIRMAISRALDNFDPNLHQILSQQGFLTRDPRVVERKKYGQPKARKKFQFSKR